MYRTNEMYLRARKAGLRIRKKDIAVLLFGDDGRTNVVKTGAIFSGKTARLSAEQIRTLCRALHCTADELCGLTD